MSFVRLFTDLLLLRRNMRRSSPGIEAVREKKLRTILTCAYDHSLLYRRTFEEPGITREQIGARRLSDFPTTNKKIVTENFDEPVTVPDLKQEDLHRFDENSSQNQETFLGKYRVVHSSGSTGILRYFRYDNAVWNRMVTGIIRGASWDLSIMQILHILSKGIRILYVAAVNGRYGGAMAVRSRVDGLHGSSEFIYVNTPLS